MNFGWLLPILILVPGLLGVACLFLRSARAVLRLCAIGTLGVAAIAGAVTLHVFRFVPLFAGRSWFMLDALSAYHLAVMMMVFSISALYGVIYFRDEVARGTFTDKQARRYGGLWFGSLAAMVLVLVSNNLGIMWVGIEATTLLTAFLICIHPTAAALEAMWKYLLMCSVGVAVAFMGTLLIAASAQQTSLHGSDALLWTALRDAVHQLDPALLKAGFIFLVIGYGTKAGLAPMHNWLPDAHSQAPSPVSAVFSGFLLNAALYCILRFLPLVEAATGNTGWGRGILIALGLLSIVLAAMFILFQRDIKRLLAYSSVEHVGLIALGVGLGGFGAVAALFHMLSHSLAKTVSFASAGMLGQSYGTHDLRHFQGIVRRVPVWGTSLVIGLLVLIGIAPFSIFLSEFFILKAALSQRAYWTACLLLVGLCVVFISVLRSAIAMAWESDTGVQASHRFKLSHGLLVFIPLAVLLVLGVWMPESFVQILIRASELLGGTP